MEEKNAFFTSRNLQRRLITQRVKQAKRQHDREILAGYCRDKSNSRENDKGNSSADRFSQDLTLFRNILPPRRQWVHLKDTTRYFINGKKQKQKITSIRQNFIALSKTVQKMNTVNCPISFCKNM